MNRYFDTEEAIEAALENLRQNRCPWCGTTGALTRHDSIWKYGARQYGLRGKRVYCDPDSIRGKGCGRTHTVALRDPVGAVLGRTGADALHSGTALGISDTEGLAGCRYGHVAQMRQPHLEVA